MTAPTLSRRALSRATIARQQLLARGATLVLDEVLAEARAFLAGLWSTTLKKGVATLALEPFLPIGEADRAALAEGGSSYCGSWSPGRGRSRWCERFRRGHRVPPSMPPSFTEKKGRRKS
jgi:hypothetical protein